MTDENEQFDRKSLRSITGRSADWEALARDCVCFANGSGGHVLIGIEDEANDPPANQSVDPALLDTLRRRIGELTVNVQALPSLVTAANGGQYIELAVSRSNSVASTSDGRYFLRVGDTCQPVLGDDVLRLANERPGRPWEAMSSGVPIGAASPAKRDAFVAGIRMSERVKASVKEKTDHELLAHYGLAAADGLTNLGVLLVGSMVDRQRLGTAPLVQAIKYDERGNKINKWLWDDGALSPVDLVDAVWREVPDFRESYEIPEGLYRRQVPAYDEKVVRELLVNALVHRPYTQRGDIYLNLHPDRLEIVNPGRLPLGVTPRNILHASRRRNEGLARVFHDLGLMEREGSGFDLVYDRMLSSGRPAPILVEGTDSVHVMIERRIVKSEVIRLIAVADERFQLSQRERITLGILAQSEGMTARELAEHLEVAGADALVPWFGRLLKLDLVKPGGGRTQAMQYFIPPQLLSEAGISVGTSLRRIEPHRLEALVEEDLRRYPGSAIGKIHARLGAEIARTAIKRTIENLARSKRIRHEGEKKGRRYWLTEP